MKRSALALLSAVALGALITGSVAAMPILGTLDQSNDAGTASVSSTNNLAQTFTAGKAGLLTAVRLWVSGTSELSVEIEGVTGGEPDGSRLALSFTEIPSETAGWVYFPFIYPTLLNAGTTYAVVFNTNDYGTDTAWGSTDTYSGGAAMTNVDAAWTSVSADLQDFAFGTYIDPLTIALQWDKTQLTAGETTPLTLTETLVFPNYTAPGAVVGPDVTGSSPVWTVKSDNLPAWFAVASVACSSQIAAADCVVANVAPGASMPVTADGNPVVLTLTGSASPTAAGADTGKAEACVDYPVIVPTVVPAAPTVTVCVSDQQSVAVVAATTTLAPATAAPTLPPTSADGSPTPTQPGLAIWLLPACLAAGTGTMLLLSRRPDRNR